MAGDANVQAMQHSMNRFWGQLFGAALVEDGVIGKNTNDAFSAIIDGLSGIGLDDESIVAISSPYYAQDYASVTPLLDTVADQQNWNYDASGVKGDGGGPAGAGSAQPQHRVAPTKVTKPGSVSASINSIASKLGLPTWVLYMSGAAIAIGTTAVIVKKHKEHRPALRRRAA